MHSHRQASDVAKIDVTMQPALQLVCFSGLVSNAQYYVRIREVCQEQVHYKLWTLSSKEPNTYSLCSTRVWLGLFESRMMISMETSRTIHLWHRQDFWMYCLLFCWFKVFKKSWFLQRTSAMQLLALEQKQVNPLPSSAVKTLKCFSDHGKLLLTFVWRKLQFLQYQQ